MMQNSKIMDTKMSNPAKVAKDGYEALMKGDDKIVSGLKNKAIVAASNVIPDPMVTEQLNKMQQPKGKDKKSNYFGECVSIINTKAGSISGLFTAICKR